METQTITQLDPRVLLADDNSRFALKETRIETLAADILDKGGVMSPIEVEPLETPVDGKTHRVTVGHYRTAALLKLNSEGAGLLMPCIVNPLGNVVLRLKRQLSENMERENQSPMDQAVAIKRLFDAGVPKMEVRKMFSRPGGRKGLRVQPASNSFINMTVSFLDLPKPIQEKIHDGRVGVGAAYELTKVPIEKRASVLEQAEKDRQSQIDREEKDEEKYLASEKKASEAKSKQDEAEKYLADLKAKQEAALVELKARGEAAAEAYRAAKLKIDDAAAKAAAAEKLKEAEKASQAAERAAADLTKQIAKAEVKTLTAAQQAAKRAKELKDKREATKKGNTKVKDQKGVGPQQVKKAAAQQGVATDGRVLLNATEMRQVIKDLGLPSGYPKVQAIGLAIWSCFESKITDKALFKQLQLITGERKEDKPVKKEAKPDIIS